MDDLFFHPYFFKERFSLREMKRDSDYLLIIHQYFKPNSTNLPVNQNISKVVLPLTWINTLLSGSLKKQCNLSTIILPYYFGKILDSEDFDPFPELIKGTLSR